MIVCRSMLHISIYIYTLVIDISEAYTAVCMSIDVQQVCVCAFLIVHTCYE
jgi:hypothetical protein